MLIIYSTDKKGGAFFSTEEVDGHTDRKVK